MFSDEQLDKLEQLRQQQYELDIKRQRLIAQLFLHDLIAKAWSRYEPVELEESLDEEEFRARGVARKALRQSERTSGSVRETQ